MQKFTYGETLGLVVLKWYLKSVSKNKVLQGFLKMCLFLKEVLACLVVQIIFPP